MVECVSLLHGKSLTVQAATALFFLLFFFFAFCYSNGVSVKWIFYQLLNELTYIHLHPTSVWTSSYRNRARVEKRKNNRKKKRQENHVVCCLFGDRYTSIYISIQSTMWFSIRIIWWRLWWFYHHVELCLHSQLSKRKQKTIRTKYQPYDIYKVLLELFRSVRQSERIYFASASGTAIYINCNGKFISRKCIFLGMCQLASNCRVSGYWF